MNWIFLRQENKKKYFSNLINKISNQIKKNDNVLEIGSYYGAFGSQIKEKVNSYIGIELSSYASKYAKENFNLNIKNYCQNKKQKKDIGKWMWLCFW